MSAHNLARRFRRPIRDFSLGFALFTALGLPGLGAGSRTDGFIASTAHARRFEEDAAPLAQEAGHAVVAALQGLSGTGNGRQIAICLSLAIAFSTVFALNLWFARHVRQLHASFRRRK